MSGAPVLRPTERAFFDENGYVVVPGAASQEHCAAVVRTIFAFTGMDPDDPETWYQSPAKPTG
jgi:hypothetical protein